MELRAAGRKAFLQDQFHGMVLQATVQRAHIYAGDAVEPERNAFRAELRKRLDKISAQYDGAITDRRHVSNIEYLADSISERCRSALRGGRFRIGPAQKALNLHLKYLWCAGWIEHPPHCPFDYYVISELRLKRPPSWTRLDSSGEYMELVDAARLAAGAQSIAEWELAAYARLSPAVARGAR